MSKFFIMGGVIVAVAGLGAALTGWLVMLAAGIIYHEFALGAPIAYGPSVGLGLLLNLIFAGVSVSKK